MLVYYDLVYCSQAFLYRWLDGRMTHLPGMNEMVIEMMRWMHVYAHTLCDWELLDTGDVAPLVGLVVYLFIYFLTNIIF